MNTDRRPVLLDCDPGHDDAFAIWLAGAYHDLIGVTTVHGNQSLQKVTDNALKVLEVAGLSDVPVYAGAGDPLLGPARYAPGLHGESGLDGPDLPDPRRQVGAEHAVDFILDRSNAVPDLTIIATGPLTNIALALSRDPALAYRVREISVMGGSTTYGNTTPTAEFNIWADPEAARIVLDSGAPLRMVGLNLTRQASAGPEQADGFRRVGTRVGIVAAELIDFLGEQVGRLYGLSGASLHDPCAVAWLIDENLIRGRAMHVDVELAGRLTRGMTVCDQRHAAGGRVGEDETVTKGAEPNVLVGLDLDHAGFFDLLYAGLGRLPGPRKEIES